MAESNLVQKCLTNSYDLTSKSMKNITYEHSRVHDGKAFVYDLWSTACAASSFVALCIIAPSSTTGYTLHIHSVTPFMEEGRGFYRLFKSPTTVARAGSFATFQNCNHNSTIADVITAAYPTTGITWAAWSTFTSSQATSKKQLWFGGGTKGGYFQGVASVEFEAMLDQGTTYIFYLYNDTTNTNVAGMEIIYYYTT